MRLFIAILIPDAIRNEAVQIQQRLKASLPAQGISWVKPENLHFTVRFLGDQPTQRLPDLQAAMQEAVQGIEPFRIEVGGVGVFPNLRRPSVLWLGLQTGEEAMKHVYKRLEHALRSRQFEPETKAFHAHLTLARIKIPLPNLESILQTVPPVDSGSLQVNALSLMQSQLHPAGSIYTELFQARLE